MGTMVWIACHGHGLQLFQSKEQYAISAPGGGQASQEEDHVLCSFMNCMATSGLECPWKCLETSSSLSEQLCFAIVFNIKVPPILARVLAAAVVLVPLKGDNQHEPCCEGCAQAPWRAFMPPMKTSC